LLVRTVDLMLRSDSTVWPTTQPAKPVMDVTLTALRVAMGEPLTPGVQRALITGVRSLEREGAKFRMGRSLGGELAYLAFLATRDTSMASMAQRIRGGTMIELDASRALVEGDTAKAREIAATFITPDSTRKLTQAMGGMRVLARADVMERLGDPAVAVGYYEALDPSRFNLSAIVSPGMTLYVRSFFALGRLYEQLNEPIRARAAYEKFLAWWPVEDPITATERAAAKAALNRLRDRAR
jgi:hypothetical protein